MRAVIHRRYGRPADVLRIDEVPVPEPGTNQVLVRVGAAAVARGDAHIVSGRPYLMRVMGFGFLRPKHRVPGQNVAGEVVAVGPGVSAFTVGDAVFGQAPHGAFAEYVAVKVERLAAAPTTVSPEVAATIPISGQTALQGLRHEGGLQSGERVLINGASGGVGSFAVQIARALGGEVTGVASTRNLERVRALGAHHVVDYTREDFTRGDQRYDLILDLVGTGDLDAVEGVLAQGGRYVTASGSQGNWLGPILWMTSVSSKDRKSAHSFKTFIQEAGKEKLAELARMVDAGQIRPLVGATRSLEEVPLAIAEVASGHTRGTIAIRI